MTELETVKEIKEETKETEPKLILGQVPCFNVQLIGAIWNIIKPHVKKFADESAGEYSVNDIWQSIYFGKSFVYFSYLSKDEKDIEYANRGNEFANLLALRYLTQKKEKDFCAFMIIRFDPDSVHIWNAYIFPEYQNTNIFEIGYQAVEKVLKDIGTPAITFSSSREAWGKKIEEIGFKEIYTIYRKELSE
jgi:hypothetical protein